MNSGNAKASSSGTSNKYRPLRLFFFSQKANEKGRRQKKTMSSHLNPKPLSSEEIAQMIAAFLDKNGGNSKKVVMKDDYPFELKSIYDVNIKTESIAGLGDGRYTYNGIVKLHKSDKVSGVSDSGKSYIINGTAFFKGNTSEDSDVLKVEIGRIIQHK